MLHETLEPRWTNFFARLVSGMTSLLLSSYSKGMRQKILLSAALIHNPDVLILDEPFSGLDVSSALVLRRLLTGLAQHGKIGSAQESVRVRILRGSTNSNEFGLGGGQTLRLQ